MIAPGGIDPPLISVIIASYQASATIERCLNSIWSQRDASYEILVIDGGSTDGTRELVQRNAGRIAHVVSEPDRGICDAWNKGLDRAAGQWILFLGADDELYDSRVFAEMHPLLTEKTRDVIFGRVTMRGGPWHGHVLGTPWRWNRFRFCMTIPHQAAFHRAALFVEVGTFDERFRISADYELLLRKGAALSTLYTDRIIASMGGDGISITNPQLTYSEARLAQIEHGSAARALIELAYCYYMLRFRLLRKNV